MRLTFAMGMNPYQMALFNDIKPPNVLVSFAYSKVITEFKYKPEYFILDSGAFTAWNSGKSVDIDKYAEWALQNINAGTKLVAVNLDVIPGEAGRTSTRQERLDGMKQSLINADYLRSKNLEVMEVFHQDEPLSFLDTLLDRLPTGHILGLSPRNDVSVLKKDEWQQLVLRHLVNRYGKNKIPKTHGLAVTSMRLMKSFPYYSVDSSSWASAMRFGTFINEFGKSNKLEAITPKNIGETYKKETVLVGMREAVENYIHIGDSITNLWKQRGVYWSD